MRTNEKQIHQVSDIGGKRGGFLRQGAGSTWNGGWNGRKENDAQGRGWAWRGQPGCRRGRGTPKLRWAELDGGNKRTQEGLCPPAGRWLGWEPFKSLQDLQIHAKPSEQEGVKDAEFQRSPGSRAPPGFVLKASPAPTRGRSQPSEGNGAPQRTCSRPEACGAAAQRFYTSKCLHSTPRPAAC